MAHSVCQDIQGILPPQINGKPIGFLTVTVGDVLFHSIPLKNVNIFISWWGEKEPTLMSTAKRRARYEIRTSMQQFEKYLKDCECLKIKIVDEDDSENIGWVTLLDLWLILYYCPYKSYFPIENSHGQYIGELHIEFNIHFSEKKVPKTFRNQNEVTSTCDVSMGNRNSISQDYKHSSYINGNESDTSKIKGDFSYPKPRLPNTCSLRDIAKSKPSSERYTDSGFETLLSDSGTQGVNALQNDTEDEINIMDYILGKNMSTIEEKKAVNFLKRWPALESVLAAISNDSEETKKLDNESAAEKISLKHQTDVSGSIYSLPSMGFHVYLKIISVELTSLDACEMYKSSISIFTASGATYFIEYRFPTSTQNVSKMKPWKEPLQGVRMSSKKQVGSVVFFNQSSIHKLSTNHKAMEEQLATNLIFRIHSRHLNQRVPSLIGEARVLFEDLLPDNVQASQLRKIPILTTHSFHHKSKGMLVLRVKWVSIAKNLDCYANGQSQKTKETLMDMTSSDVCLKSSMQKKELSQSVKKHEKEKSLENKLMLSVKDPLLHALICVPEAYYCLTETDSLDISKKTSFNMYLVCRAFWNKGISPKSQVYWSSNNPKFEFSEVEPLLLSPNFVDMCQNNFMVVELWNKKVKNGKDTLLGIAKVSVHQFYVAYKDPTVLEELMKLKYPAISMDGNVRVFSPMDPSNTCGWLRVLLAIGTQEQVYFLRKSHFAGLHSRSEITEKSRKQSSHDSLQNGVEINDKAEVEKDGLDIVITTLEKNMQIDRLSGFAPFSKTSSFENSDCYVEYRLPLPNNQELKKTSVKPVSSIVNFFSPPVCIKCPENITGEITFYVWCRCYHSNTPPRDRMVARTKLPLSILFSRGNDSLTEGWTRNFSLPLAAIENPTQDDNHAIGFLVLKVFDKADAKFKTLAENVSFQPNEDPEKTLQLKYNLNEKKTQECQTDALLDDAIELRSIFENLHEPVSSQMESLTECQSPNENELLVDHRFMSTKEKEPIDFADIQESSLDSHPKSDNLNEGFCEIPIPHRSDKKSITDLFKAHIEIHQAVHLKPESPICGVYVTFWSYNNEQLWVTPNIYTGSNPRWNWHCDTYLSGELLIDSSKKLILKVWTKRDARSEPDPSKDISLGFASMDLNVLNYGMPQISGWFNIFSSGQKCIGQIKVTVTPMEDLSKFREITKTVSFTKSLKLKDPCISALMKHTRQQSSAELPSKLTKSQEIKSLPHEFGTENVFIGLEEKMLEEQCRFSSIEGNGSPEVASQILKSKIDELEEMMKKWKEKFLVAEDQQSLHDAIVDVEKPELHRSNTYGKSLDLASPSEASISSNNSRKFSSVNPSTDLKILEKYISELMHGISTQNSDNALSISPGLEELFLQFGNYDFESMDQETRGEVCQNEQNPDFIMPIDLDLEKVENQCVNQKDISELIQDAVIDEFSESCQDMPKSSKALTSSSNSSLSINEYGNSSNFGSEDRLGEATEEEQSIDCVKELEASMGENEVNAQLQVLDLPRQAPEGGNPREDETIQAQPQNISQEQNQIQDNDCSRNDSIVHECDRIYDNQEIQRIAKIFSSTFPKT